jgi:biotin-(acetyl-CoA carboxylase) ligase
MRASDGNAVKLEFHDMLTSTAALAKKYANENYPDRYVVLTDTRVILDEEEKVRGYERGIFLSLILRPSIFPSQATLVNPMSAVSLLQGLEAHTDKRLGLGWVGKLYCDGRLIGETGVEGKLDSFTSYEYLVISFSCVMSKKNFPTRLSDLIKKVFSEEETSIPIIIAMDIINRFFLHYKNLKTPSKFMEIYRQKFILRNQTVSYISEGKKRRCTVMGIDPKNCALLLSGRDKRVFEISTPKSVIIPKKIRIK